MGLEFWGVVEYKFLLPFFRLFPQDKNGNGGREGCLFESRILHPLLHFTFAEKTVRALAVLHRKVEINIRLWPEHLPANDFAPVFRYPVQFPDTCYSNLQTIFTIECSTTMIPYFTTKCS